MDSLEEFFGPSARKKIGASAGRCIFSYGWGIDLRFGILLLDRTGGKRPPPVAPFTKLCSRKWVGLFLFQRIFEITNYEGRMTTGKV
jgi:hypothetical protein